jgi:type III pantothenate kinase
MLLLVDAGNTRIKWALADLAMPDGAKLGQWRVSGSVTREQVAQLAPAWSDLNITRAILSNVAGPVICESLEQILLRGVGIGVGVAPTLIEWFASLPVLAGIRNGYRQPEQLGSDRFASAIGGHALFPHRPLIIATCGTATTIDALAADGFFAGGMIIPGLSLMASSLARNTAQLPEVLRQNEQCPLFADNTEEAIAGGCMAAQVGAIERAFANYSHLTPDESVQCLMSGGAAASIVPHLAIPYAYVDNLVLIGLQTVALQTNIP